MKFIKLLWDLLVPPSVLAWFVEEWHKTDGTWRDGQGLPERADRIGWWHYNGHPLDGGF
jgi:hypothetical protein